jgi:ribosomal protein S18 acetylase RimI-like enzyme
MQAVGTKFEVVTARLPHVPGIVACHLAAFPGQFLALLGPVFLADYYRFYADHPRSICRVAEGSEGEVLGFVTGGAPEIRSEFLRRRLPWLAGTVAWRACRDSRVRSRLATHGAGLLRAIAGRLGLQDARVDQPQQDPPGTWSSLLSIAVRPEAGGRGIGAALLESFRQASARSGYRWMRLSVHNDNEPALRLYRAGGWQTILVTPGGTYFRRSVEGGAP